MKIEKINDNQIKFFLTKKDLKLRDIKIQELAYGSEKTQELFHEIMEQANEECNFKSENIPLMIEAVPLAPEELMIIVTKISNNSELEDKFNMLTNIKKEYNENAEKDELEKESKLEEKTISKNSIVIYSFTNLDNTINATKAINNLFSGESILYKLNGVYFLILFNINKSSKISNIKIILSEYGIQYKSNVLSKQYILEHGKKIIDKNAVSLLSKI